jgi:dethiobiotin synthetase
MNIFISGTDTDVGKTLIASWIALHTGFAYFKPIQTGTEQGTDAQEVARLSHATIHPAIYQYPEPLSPHAAAIGHQDRIEIDRIRLPRSSHLVIEGAGGVLVPLNDTSLMIDLIQQLEAPVLLVARTTLGTINHTLLSLESLRARRIPVFGVILNGEPRPSTTHAIQTYGAIPVLAEFPRLAEVNRQTLAAIPLPEKLHRLLSGASS